MTKPTVGELAEQLDGGIDGLEWHTSGSGVGMFQVAMVRRPGGELEWVLVRLVGDASNVLVFDPHEWSCFLDGAKHGEFDDLA